MSTTAQIRRLWDPPCDFEKQNLTLHSGELQRHLIDEGLDPGSVDGVFGTKTTAAVTAFPRATGLTPDGVSGPLTDLADPPHVTGCQPRWTRVRDPADSSRPEPHTWR